MGLPRYKAKHKARLSCRFTTGTLRIDDRRHVVLPRLGRIHVHEDLTGLLAKTTAGDLRILSATVRHERGRWFVSLQVEERRDDAPAVRMQDAVGVDLGVKTLAVCADSTGEILPVPNPQHYEHALRRLRKASRRVSRRQGPDHRRGVKASRRWEKANTERNRLHHRVANLRENHLHQTTAALAAQYGTVVVEDLNVAGMMKNRRLSRRIAGASFAQIRRQLGYKTLRHGGRLLVAGRWYASSKTCSGCGVVKAKLPLSCRVFSCDACGLVLDRDVNAARNLAALAARTAGTGVAGDQDTPRGVSKPRGADRKTRTTRPPTQRGGRGGQVARHRDSGRKRETVPRTPQP
jgi:putative transposase